MDTQQRVEEPSNKTERKVWTLVNGQLTPIDITIGSSDGVMTEVLKGNIDPGTELVTDILTNRRK